MCGHALNNKKKLSTMLTSFFLSVPCDPMSPFCFHQITRVISQIGEKQKPRDPKTVKTALSPAAGKGGFLNSLLDKKKTAQGCTGVVWEWSCFHILVRHEIQSRTLVLVWDTGSTNLKASWKQKPSIQVCETQDFTCLESNCNISSCEGYNTYILLKLHNHPPAPVSSINFLY